MTSASPQPRPGDWFGIVAGSSGRVQLQQTAIEHAQGAQEYPEVEDPVR